MDKAELDKSKKKIYYWSPSVNWKLIDGKLKIEKFIYDEEISKMFPEFYFIAQDGIEIDKVIEFFHDVKKMKLKAFVKDLINKRILTNSILTPSQIFYQQEKLVEHDYSKNLIYDTEDLNIYKKIQLNRKYEYEDKGIIKLSEMNNFPEIISKRKSYREFDNNTISFEVFSNLISVFKQNVQENGDIKYYYASAGGLYPIDVYIYVKKDRVENVNQGLYYYSPINNSLSIISDAEISEEAHYYSNKDIFNSSAISIFFIYNAQANIPKYGGDGYLYACLDTGIMVSTFTAVAEYLGLGLCSIGDMNFKKIEKKFKLNKDQVLIHELECGIKSN